MKPLVEVALLFLKLGLTAFGGPAAHVGIMYDEVVKRRAWLTGGEFMDLLGATNLIPGPNSTEMAIHIGHRRAGWPGLIAGGLGFITPAMLMVLGLAWLYVRYGTTPKAVWLMYGIKPAVIAIVAQALWSLKARALKNRVAWMVAAAVFGLYFLRLNELALLFAGGVILMAVANWKSGKIQHILSLVPAAGAGLLPMAVPFSMPVLFMTFLKIGSVLYGSGYVLLAFLRADFVDRLGWLTDQQLIDAVAIGQVTPGPLFTAATFIGYLLAGLPGGLLATLAIFLPSFLFVAVSNPLIPRMRSSPWLGSLLDGVNASALGLMAAVTVQIGGAAFTDALTVLIGLLCLVLLIRFKLNSTWLIAGGALVGYVASAVG